MPQSILVTGASSFIGGWIVQYLVEKGYYVRGTVRSTTKATRVLEDIPQEYHSLMSFVYIRDIATDSFDDAVQGMDRIIHVASPFHFKTSEPEKDLLLPAIRGTLGVLQAAHKYNQSHDNKIRQVVITSSFAAIFDYTQGFRPGYTYTEKDWAPGSYELGAAATNDPIMAYRMSKLCAERAAWDFIEKEKPSFTIATLCEPLVFGPRVGGFKSLEDMNTSNGTVWALIKSGRDAQVPATRVPWEIDVRDVARAHVAAVERVTDTNERYLIAGDIWSNQKIVDIIHESSVIPDDIKSSTPVGNKGEQLPDHYQIDCSKVERELGIKYISLKTTIEDLVLQLAELAKITQ